MVSDKYLTCRFVTCTPKVSNFRGAYLFATGHYYIENIYKNNLYLYLIFW